MGIWVLAAILTLLLDSITTQRTKPHWGLENEALIVPCPYNPNSSLPVDWYYRNEPIIAQKGDRVLASGNFLKFLPAKVNDSGIYTCTFKRANRIWTRNVNLTIAKEPNCIVPDYLKYSTVSGNEKFAKIHCPRTVLYNWTGPLEWFKNCKVLQEPKYSRIDSDLIIQEATHDDEGDYTCKLIHNENGVSYAVTATRALKVKSKPESHFLIIPVIKAPLDNAMVEVEIGKPANIICSGCVGQGSVSEGSVKWQVNAHDVNDSDEGIRQEQVERENSTDGFICLKRTLIIPIVKEEDLSQKYMCLAYNLRAVTVHTIKLRRKSPVDYQSIYYIVAGFSVLLILISILTMLLKIFWIDFILLWRDMVGPYKTRNDGKIYDAYVIYPRNYKKHPKEASSVDYFVHQILPDVLENKCGYNLCIYGRDMLPGEDAVTAVETNIQKSRRHIFILTPQIMHSQGFAYEQEVALHCALIQNNSKVILIEMEPLTEQNELQFEEFQESLKHLIKTQGTIKWREDHMANKWSLNSKFWKHVRYQMPMPKKLPKRTINLVSLSVQGQ